MQLVKRRFVYTFTYRSKFGESVELKTVYDIEFRRYDDRKCTYITVKPDFGPPKRLKVVDVGITWKSLLRASEWCSSDSKNHLDTWLEMDIADDAKNNVPLVRENGVIPEQKFSTGIRNG